MPETKGIVVFQWIEPCTNLRLRDAQAKLKESILDLGLEPVLFPAGPELVKLRDILQYARDHCDGRSFVWCNSDVVLKKNPYEVDDGDRIHGFHRTEIPSGEICAGVDMYLVPCRLWDDWLRDDAPDMWCGATHIDWWLSRSAQKRKVYASHLSFIEHTTHPVAGASKKSGNPYYDHNVAAYNSWARSQGLPIFRAEPQPARVIRCARQLIWKLRWKINGLFSRLVKISRKNSVPDQL